MPYALRRTLACLHAPMPLRLLASMLLFALCTLNFELLQAQYFTLGTDPASVRWNQIRTENFKIIYPNTLDSHALYLANAFEYFHAPGSASLDASPRKWPVILHNNAVNSNAFVPYAPKRIELLSMPPQDNFAQSWIDQLVIHEYRHTVQYTSLNKGLTRALSVIFGQQAVPAVIGLFVPLWFIEGDAVVIETATSNTGRGRAPSFEMKLKAQFSEKGIYSYDKAVNGSYKDFTPDRYELGYQLVGQTRVQYGQETWSKVMNKTGKIPLMMVPFSHTLSKETGYGKGKLYQKITTDLKQAWQAAGDSLQTSHYTPLLRSHGKAYTNYTRPLLLQDGRMVARKTSLSDIPRIIQIDAAGDQEVLITPGSMIDEGISGSGSRICWAELSRDPRWDLRTYSIIKIYDLETGQLKKITKKSRLFSPALSPDGQFIAAVEVDEQNLSHLVIMNSETGDLIYKYPAPGNYFMSYPAWSPDGQHVAVVMTRDEGKSLVLLGFPTPGLETLIPFSNTEISKPAFYKHYILFTGAYSGIDNIFAFNLNDRRLYQVTSARFGATDAVVSKEQNLLYYANYTADGYELAYCPLNPGDWPETNPAITHNYELAEGLAGQEKFIFRASEVPDSAYAIKKYRKGLHLFNIHSWAPLSVDIDNMDVNPGVSVLSQNLLGTSYATLGYSYDLNEETGKYYLKYSYEGLYPAFDVTTDYGLRRGIHQDQHGNVNEYKYNEFNVAAGVRVPLAWNVRSWFMGARPYAGYSYKYLRMDPNEELQFRKDRIHSLDHQLFLYAQSRQSYRDLQPRWGQLLEFNYNFTPFESDTGSSIFSAEMLLYVPGFLHHHGLRLYGGYQDRLVNLYRYGGLISTPRGYSGIYADEAVSFSATYVFPVFYPDWHIGPVIYLKRLKAGVFFDHLSVFDQSPYQNYNSLGLDLTVDFHLFRLFAPMEAGVRTVYLLNNRSIGFEFLYKLNLDSLY